MDTPWSPEQVVTPELARALLGEAFPELAEASVEPLGDGWDNTAYLVDGEWVFRFPRRTIAVPLIENECRLLPALAPTLPLPIPVPERVGAPGRRYPWPFAGYRRLAGTTACRADLDEAARVALARPLGAFLARLHAYPVEEARRLGAVPDELGRLDGAKRWPMTRERLATAAERGWVEDAGAFDELERRQDLAWEPSDAHVIHGDLYARHLLVDGERALCGVIDWGDVHRGDPATDLAIAHSFLPPRAHAAFREAYGPIDASRWEAARQRALFSLAAVLVFGHEVGDEALQREAHRALGFLRAGLA